MPLLFPLSSQALWNCSYLFHGYSKVGQQHTQKSLSVGFGVAVRGRVPAEDIDFASLISLCLFVFVVVSNHFPLLSAYIWKRSFFFKPSNALTLFSFCLLYFYSMFLESVYFLFIWSVPLHFISTILLLLVLIASGGV